MSLLCVFLRPTCRQACMWRGVCEGLRCSVAGWGEHCVCSRSSRSKGPEAGVRLMFKELKGKLWSLCGD